MAIGKAEGARGRYEEVDTGDPKELHLKGWQK
jgi:hypothetical protein